jgi:hypothetical protein
MVMGLNPEAPKWYDDTQEIVAFVRWFLEDTTETWRLATDIFEKPWHYDEEYDAYLEGRDI